jgi:hypothetical protein
MAPNDDPISSTLDPFRRNAGQVRQQILDNGFPKITFPK